jgi:hypothetical protein
MGNMGVDKNIFFDCEYNLQIAASFYYSLVPNMPTENLSDAVKDFFRSVSMCSPPQVEIHTLMVAK